MSAAWGPGTASNKKKGYGVLLPRTSPTGPLNVVNNNDSPLAPEDQAGPSNVVDSSDTLVGLEDLTHGTDDNGIPFILVDGAACTTRSGLDLALRRVEQKRMEQVLQDIGSSDLTQLEDTEPPPELDMDINLSSKALAQRRAVEKERQFQQDIVNLTFWPPEDDDSCTTETTTGDNDNASIEEVIHKLEQLRGLTKQVPASETLPVRPGIQRQGTFDIKRKDEGDKDSGSDLATAETAASKKPQTPKPLYRSGIPSFASRKQPDNKYLTVRARQLVNHIGDLLLEFHTLNQQENNGVVNEGSAVSYMVTISPANGVSNCTIVPVPNPKFNNLSLPQSQSSTNTNSHPKRTSSDLNSRVLGRQSSAPAPLKQPSPVAYSKERFRSQGLHKPSTFINIPSPARYNQGRKRD